jgi:rRNA maturation protein Rpf1
MIKMSVEEIKEIIRPCFITNEIKGNPWIITYLDRKLVEKYHRVLSFWKITSSRT